MRLDVDGLAFAYDSDPVLEGVSLSVERGELLGVIGPNGSGKSTLLRCVNRILDPDDGSVYLDETAADSLDRNEIAKLVGYVPQSEPRTFPSTVFDTVLMGRKPHGSWRASESDREIVSRTIERLGLEPLALRSMDELSGGQARKVLIGRALVQEASVLLLDEPTSGLDVRHQLEVLDLIRERIDAGMTGVIAIHDLNLAMRYCDSLALLHDGEIVSAGTPDDLTAELIREVYGVEATITEHDGRRLVIPEKPI